MVAFEIGGAFRPWIVAWIVAWPSSSFAQPPTPTEPFHPVASEASSASTLKSSHLRTVSFGGFKLGKRGIEYQNSFVLRRRELSYRVWGGRSRKQPAIGIDFEPTLQRHKLRVGAYGSAREVGIAVRLRY